MGKIKRKSDKIYCNKGLPLYYVESLFGRTTFQIFKFRPPRLASSLHFSPTFGRPQAPEGEKYKFREEIKRDHLLCARMEEEWMEDLFVSHFC